MLDHPVERVIRAIQPDEDPSVHSDDIIRRVVRAIHDLKLPPPEGSDHYRSGWDDGLEAAIDAAKGVLTDEED